MGVELPENRELGFQVLSLITDREQPTRKRPRCRRSRPRPSGGCPQRLVLADDVAVPVVALLARERERPVGVDPVELALGLPLVRVQEGL